jgi:hypothetical protein
MQFVSQRKCSENHFVRKLFWIGLPAVVDITFEENERVKNCKLNVGKDLQFIDLNMKNALNR